jgi:short-subunit dehydrogenase
METIAFLGCSRGLGRSVAVEYSRQNPDIHSLLVSRKKESLEDLSEALEVSSHIYACDFSRAVEVDELIEELDKLQPHKIFYFAGGGPYGLFGEKKWSDHQWAFEVSFLTPARLIHHFLKSPKNLSQFVVVGSTIADDKADPMAASYASGKHALKGLVDSINSEGSDLDLRIFRPGYMDTSMLPPQAQPRLNGAPLLDPEEAAKSFVNWVLDSSAAKSLCLEAPG